jgi:O-antigen/teichoic acid export membrane protein
MRIPLDYPAAILDNGMVNRWRSRKFAGPVLLTASGIAGQVSSGLLSIVATRRLVPSDRGVLATVLSAGPLFSMACAAGLPAAVAFGLASGRVTDQHVRRLARRWAAMASVAAAVVIEVVDAGLNVRTDRYFALSLAMLVWVICAIQVAFAHAVCVGLQRYRQAAWLVVGISTAPALAAVGASMVGSRSVGLLLTCYALMALPSGIISHRILRRAAQEPEDEDDASSDSLASDAVVLRKYGRRVVLGTAMSNMNGRLDVMVAAFIMGSALGGVYAAAASLSVLPLVAFSSIGQVALPYTAARSRSRASIGKFVQQAALVSISASLVIALVAAVAIGRLVQEFYGPRYGGAAAAARWLAPGFAIWGGGLIVNQVLRGAGEPTGPAIADGVSVVWLALALVVVRPSTPEALAKVSATSFLVSVLISVGAAVRFSRLSRGAEAAFSVEANHDETLANTP